MDSTKLNVIMFVDVIYEIYQEDLPNASHHLA